MDQLAGGAIVESVIHIVQVFEGINTIQLAGLDQGIEKGCPFSPMFIAGEQGVFPKQGNRSDSTLSAVVVRVYFSIFGK
jgi:hypothetical protein